MERAPQPLSISAPKKKLEADESSDDETSFVATPKQAPQPLRGFAPKKRIVNWADSDESSDGEPSFVPGTDESSDEETFAPKNLMADLWGSDVESTTASSLSARGTSSGSFESSDATSEQGSWLNGWNSWNTIGQDNSATYYNGNYNGNYSGKYNNGNYDNGWYNKGKYNNVNYNNGWYNNGKYNNGSHRYGPNAGDWNGEGHVAKGKTKKGGRTGTRGTCKMIRNIPCDWTRQQLIDLLHKKDFRGHFDFVYCSFDHRRPEKNCLGFAFVNFLTQADADRCEEVLEGFKEWGVATKKILSVGNAVLHGQQKNVEKWRNDPVMHPDVPDDWKPVIFDERGKKLPFPEPTTPTGTIVKVPEGFKYNIAKDRWSWA